MRIPMTKKKARANTPTPTALIIPGRLREKS